MYRRLQVLIKIEQLYPHNNIGILRNSAKRMKVSEHRSKLLSEDLMMLCSLIGWILTKANFLSADMKLGAAAQANQ